MKVPTLHGNQRPMNWVPDGTYPYTRWSVADINVERKGPSVWPWVVGLLVLALLIWALVEMFEGDAEPALNDPVADTTFVDTIGTPP